MRIAFLSNRFAPDLGGVAASATRIAHALVGLGHEVEVFTVSRQLEPGAIERSDGSPSVFRIGAFASTELMQQTWLQVIEERQSRAPFDLMWGHYLLPCGFLAVYAARCHGVRSVVAARGNDIDRDIHQAERFGQLEWTLRQANSVLAVSRDIATKIGALVPGVDVQVLANAVDAKVFAPRASDPGVRMQFAVPDGAPLLGFSGELRYKKGATHLFAALVALPQAHLLVIGELRSRDREQFDRLRLATPGLVERVHITGHIDDAQEVARLLASCDCMLLPSLWDGMPNSLLEAMALGVPVIASDAGGIPEVLRDGQDGIVIPRPQLGCLDSAIRELLDADAEVIQRLTSSARQRVCDDFSPEKERKHLRALLADHSAS